MRQAWAGHHLTPAKTDKHTGMGEVRQTEGEALTVNFSFTWNSDKGPQRDCGADKGVGEEALPRTPLWLETEPRSVLLQVATFDCLTVNLPEEDRFWKQDKTQDYSHCARKKMCKSKCKGFHLK